MELVKRVQLNDQELKAMEVLDPAKKLIVAAMVDEKILSMTEEDGVSFVYEQLKVAEINSGLTKIKNIDLVALGFSTYELIKQNHKNLTVTEFKISCRDGVIEKFGKWYGMCLKSISQWINGYVNQKIRLAAIKEWNNGISKELTATKPIHYTPEQFKKIALQSFEDYKKSGKLPYVPSVIYDVIKQAKGSESLITKDQWPEVRDRGIEEFKKRHTLFLPEHRKKKAMEVIDLLEHTATIERCQKGVALKIYFDGLIKEGKDLEI